MPSPHNLRSAQSSPEETAALTTNAGTEEDEESPSPDGDSARGQTTSPLPSEASGGEGGEAVDLLSIEETEGQHLHNVAVDDPSPQPYHAILHLRYQEG